MDTIERKKHLQKYRRDYYRNKYHESEDYRKTKQDYNLTYYKKKTIKCVVCETRCKFATLQEYDYKYDPERFVCPDCKVETEHKQDKVPRRGRPRSSEKSIFSQHCQSKEKPPVRVDSKEE